MSDIARFIWAQTVSVVSRQVHHEADSDSSSHVDDSAHLFSYNGRSELVCITGTEQFGAQLDSAMTGTLVDANPTPEKRWLKFVCGTTGQSPILEMTKSIAQEMLCRAIFLTRSNNTARHSWKRREKMTNCRICQTNGIQSQKQY